MMSAVLRWLLLIVVLASFLRLFHLQQTPPGLYPDEAMNGNNALEALRTGQFEVFYPENNGREGLMIAIQALSLRVFGVREPWVLRAPSPIIGVLTVVGMFFLGRELFSPSVGVFASFLMATSTWHIYFSRMGFRAILAPLLMVWALFFFLVSLRSSSTARRWIGPAIAGGALFGLGFYSYIAFRLMPLVLLALLPWRRRTSRFWPQTGVFTIAAFVVALPIGLYFLGHPEDFFARATGISVFSRPQPISYLFDNIAKTVGMLFVAGDPNWRHNFAGHAELFWPVALLLAAGVARACYTFFGGLPNGLTSALLLTWAAVALLPAAMTTDGVPSSIRSILMLPPVLLLAAEAGVVISRFLGERLKPSWLTPAIGFGLCVALAAEAYYTYFILYANRPEVSAAFNADYVSIGRTIEGMPADVRKIVVDDAEGIAVRDHRMPTQTVMFITDTFDPELAERKNVIYVDPEELAHIEPGVTFHLKRDFQP